MLLGHHTSYTCQVRAERKSAHDTSVGPNVLGPGESADDASNGNFCEVADNSGNQQRYLLV